MNKYIDSLFDTPLFLNIGKDELGSLLKCLKPYVKDYDKGNYIMSSGESVSSIGVVMEGKVQMVKEDVWGDKSILAVMEKNGIFGETFACSNSKNSIVSFQAASDCTVLFLSFHNILHSCPKSCMFHYSLMENMVSLIAHKNIQLMEKLEVTSKKILRDRILIYLSQQAQRNSSMYFTVPMGRIELADYLCTDRSSLTRELTRMRAEGLIDFDRNTFRLFNVVE